MLELKDGEGLVVRYNGKIKEFGEGVLYITTHRVCFESKKIGLCFDLDYKDLFDWTPKKKSILIRWQELEVGQDQFDYRDPKYYVEIELKERMGEKVDPLTVHYILFYVYTNRFRHTHLFNGGYLDEKGRPVHRRSPTHDVLEDGLSRITSNNVMIEQYFLSELVCEREGIEFEVKPREWLEENSGDTILEQLVYERMIMLEAWVNDGVVGNENGVRIPEVARSEAKMVILRGTREIAESQIPGWIEEAENDIRKAKAEDMELEAEDSIEITDGRILFAGGTLQDKIEYFKKLIVANKRIVEIIEEQNVEFDFFRQAQWYKESLEMHLILKLNAGEDISTWSPTVEKMKSHTIEAKKKVDAYRQRLTEVP